MKLMDRKWVKGLLLMPSFTAKEAALLAEAEGETWYHHLLIDRLRTHNQLELTTVGYTADPYRPGTKHKVKLFKLRKKELSDDGTR
jgi:hypothetical protein